MKTTRWHHLLLGGALLALVLASCGEGGLRNPLRRENLRQLPGVAQVVAPSPPAYTSSILGVKVPQALAVTQDGSRLYVAEGDGDRGVRVIDLATRTVVATLSAPQTTPGTRKPMGIAVASNGLVYVVDRLRLVVDMYDPSGQWLGLLPEPNIPAGRWQPLGVAVNAEGEVYVTNGSSEGPAVAEYTSNGLLLRTYGTIAGDRAGLSFPTGIAFGRQEGYLFASDSNNGRIAVVNGEGEIVAAYGDTAGDSSLALPRGIFIDQRGYCYVADATSHNIKVWDISTEPATFLFTFGEGGIEVGQLLYPNGVAVDGQGRVYIADTGNDRVQIWTY